MLDVVLGFLVQCATVSVARKPSIRADYGAGAVTEPVTSVRLSQLRHTNALPCRVFGQMEPQCETQVKRYADKR